jgi:hypothetical protein
VGSVLSVGVAAWVACVPSGGAAVPTAGISGWDCEVGGSGCECDCTGGAAGVANPAAGAVGAVVSLWTGLGAAEAGAAALTVLTWGEKSAGVSCRGCEAGLGSLGCVVALAGSGAAGCCGFVAGGTFVASGAGVDRGAGVVGWIEDAGMLLG